jgi:curved DNA-binding protein CbpA
MFYLDAVEVLGLKYPDNRDISAINRAWRHLVKHTHPDKNASGMIMTQRLNEARDILLASMEDEYAKKQREDEEERIASARDEAKRQQAAHYAYIKRKHAERDEYIKAKQAKRREEEEEARRQQAKRKEEEEEARRQQAQREEAIRKQKEAECKSKKPVRLVRLHRKADQYPQGKELIEEMQKFFKNSFTSFSNNKLFVTEILELFIKSRDQTTDLEKNLFKRHSKKLFLSAWPSAVYFMYKNQRCFLNVGVK